MEAEGVAQLGSSHWVRRGWALQAATAIRSGTRIISMLPLMLLGVLLLLLLGGCRMAAHLGAVWAAGLQYCGARLCLDAAAEVWRVRCRTVTQHRTVRCHVLILLGF